MITLDKHILKNFIKILTYTNNLNNDPNPSENIEFLNFLNDFNLPVTNTSLNSNSFLDPDLLPDDQEHSFQYKVSSHLKNNLNFVICLLNINSILYKFGSIKFILDQALADIFVLNEIKLDSNRCDSEFQHPKYHVWG